jgi:phosphoglycolate phosphatase-like HAD superfamily hydrolase
MIHTVEASREYFTRIDAIRDMIAHPSVPLVAGFNQTLFDTSPLRVPTLEALLDQLGIPTRIPAPLLRGNGERYVVGAMIYMSDGGDSPLFEQADAAFQERERVLERMVAAPADLSSFLMPGVSDLVRVARASGKHVAVRSGSSEGFVNAFITKSRVDGIPVDDVFVKPPEPPVFDRRTLYIGDNRSDVDEARTSSATGLIITDDDMMRARLLTSYGADPSITIISSLTEVFT